jgi:hypothetical protein
MFKIYPEEFYTDLSSNSVKNPLPVIKCVSEYICQQLIYKFILAELLQRVTGNSSNTDNAATHIQIGRHTNAATCVQIGVAVVL